MYFVHLLIFFLRRDGFALSSLCASCKKKNGLYNHKKFIKDVKRSVYILKASNWIEFDVVGLQNIGNVE